MSIFSDSGSRTMRRANAAQMANCQSAVLLLLLAAAWSSCTSLFFYPSKELQRTPADLGLEYEDITITTRDDVELHGWRLLSRQAPWARLVFFHGNAENISTHLFNVYWLPAEGVEVVLADYRGYGRSEGRPTIDGVHIDAEDVLKYSAAGGLPPAGCNFVFGQSLGASIAVVALANSKRFGIDAVVLDSGFPDYRRIAEEKLGEVWLTRWGRKLFSLGFSAGVSPEEAIAKISPVPVLLLHGSEDAIIPLHHGLEFFQSAKQPKELWVIEQGAHTDALGRAEFRLRLIEYLRNKCPEIGGRYLAVAAAGARPFPLLIPFTSYAPSQ